jgi:Flp pilus assembly protein TadG
VQLGIATVYDRPPGDRGGSAVLNWTFQVPIEYGSQRRLMARAAAAQLAHARLEYELRRQELRQQRSELITRVTVLEDGAQFAATRLAAADAAVEERGLRAVRLDGDVAEQLQRARLQRYAAAKAVVEADRAVLNWYADWARFEPAACETAPDGGAAQLSGSAGATPGSQARSARPPTGTAPEAAPAAERALYLWRSAEWLTGAASGGGADKFRDLRAAGVSRLLISLDAAQMHGALADPVPLAQAVRNTRAQGFSVELLLGDPGWIRPEGRGGLLAIIAGLKSVPFDGLHLDLEPEQLDAAPQQLAPLLLSLEQTLAAAKAASPWPLSLSIHPRDLDVEVGGGRFADALLRLHVAPTLMVYVANPDRAVAIAEPLLARHPQLSFSVALSLERSLGPQQSLWSYPQQERRRRIERVEAQLAAANFSGLTLQLEDAWNDAAGLATLATGE